MAFLDKLGDIVKNVGELAGDAIETTKLNSKINSEKSAIDGLLKQLGEYCYARYKSGQDVPEEPAALCAEIDEHNVVIEEAKAEIERIKAEDAAAAPTENLCTSCNKANAPGTKFCQECGTKLEASDKRICACGAEVAEGMKFCGECGKEI